VTTDYTVLVMGEMCKSGRNTELESEFLGKSPLADAVSGIDIRFACLRSDCPDQKTAARFSSSSS